mmetsp:Transcript_112057/g.194572  ORF Transcript_112057/g.194572 Transcript_112057/m.194572 type:complete len:490 (+) Transcript_112057:810-2279(+)
MALRTMVQASTDSPWHGRGSGAGGVTWAPAGSGPAHSRPAPEGSRWPWATVAPCRGTPNTSNWAVPEAEHTSRPRPVLDPCRSHAGTCIGASIRRLPASCVAAWGLGSTGVSSKQPGGGKSAAVHTLRLPSPSGASSDSRLPSVLVPSEKSIDSRGSLGSHIPDATRTPWKELAGGSSAAVHATGLRIPASDTRLMTRLMLSMALSESSGGSAASTGKPLRTAEWPGAVGPAMTVSAEVRDAWREAVSMTVSDRMRESTVSGAALLLAAPAPEAGATVSATAGAARDAPAAGIPCAAWRVESGVARLGRASGSGRTWGGGSVQTAVAARAWRVMAGELDETRVPEMTSSNSPGMGSGSMGLAGLATVAVTASTLATVSATHCTSSLPVATSEAIGAPACVAASTGVCTQTVSKVAATLLAVLSIIPAGANASVPAATSSVLCITGSSALPAMSSAAFVTVPLCASISTPPKVSTTECTQLVLALGWIVI